MTQNAVNLTSVLRPALTFPMMKTFSNSARQKTAVDVLNGVILLMKLEAERFQRYKILALEREDTLTDKGLKLMEQCFTDV
jgi:hypothetical protein